MSSDMLFSNHSSAAPDSFFIVEFSQSLGELDRVFQFLGGWFLAHRHGELRGTLKGRHGHALQLKRE
jgi:hypothetical protein